jgi:transposase InsO family protein
MQAVDSISPQVGVVAACRSLGVPRAALYRSRNAALCTMAHAPDASPCSHPSPPRTLSPSERQEVLDMLNSKRFADHAPIQAYFTLLDEGRYFCSPRTMYRILGENQEVRERRDQLRHPAYAKPELLAVRANEVWSWDITKLRGPAKWTCYHLYVILDIFSRYVVGWMVAARESDQLARRLIEETCRKQAIAPNQLTIHADRGSSMRSKTVAELLVDLQVTKTHSRPHTSNDNPYSESQFKTMKYRPEFPDRFGGIEDARAFCLTFFDWYNTHHRHSAIAWLTPDAMHHGQEKEALRVRQQALAAAHAIHPERFVKGQPQPPKPPQAVWINPPSATAEQPQMLPNYSEEVSQSH